MKREQSNLHVPAPSESLVVDYPLSAATAERTPVMANMLARARAFAEPLIADETLDTGENTLAHADAVAAIVAPWAVPRPCRRPATWSIRAST